MPAKILSMASKRRTRMERLDYHKVCTIEVLRSRPSHFDSTFPEVGPPPVLTSAGITVLYNGKNAVKDGDPDLGPNAYAAGAALFDGSEALIGSYDDV